MIENDPDIRELLAIQLAKAELDVVAIEQDGERGYAAALMSRPDVVLLDWVMPAVDGVEVCRRLRSEPTTAHARIVLVSARTGEHDRARAMAAGADLYVTKPFSNRMLVDQVKALAGAAG